MSPRLDLNQIGVLEGTDKSSSVRFKWDYLRHYERWFSEWRDAEINLIEIGVAGGRSLQMWRQYFSKANIVGLDIVPGAAIFRSDRIFIEIGSQDDPAFLQSVCAKYPPTIIVDDGSHLAHHVIFTFEAMFPSLLLPGGCYVVEDLELHFGDVAEKWAPKPGYDPPAYFLELSKNCLTRKGRNRLPEMQRDIVEKIDSVTFAHSAACVRKRSDQRPDVDLAAARDYLARRSLGVEGLVYYTQYMADAGHDVSGLITEIEQRRGGRKHVHFFGAFADLLAGCGQIDRSIEVLSEGARLHADNWPLLWKFGARLGEGGRFAEAIGVLARAAALCGEVPATRGIVGLIVQMASQPDMKQLAVEVLEETRRSCRDAACEKIVADGIAQLSAV